jgi:hypothetical protein
MTAITKRATISHGLSRRQAGFAALLAITIALLVTGATVVAMLSGTPTAETRPAAHAASAAGAQSFPDYGERLLAAKAAGAQSFPDYGERLLAAP